MPTVKAAMTAVPRADYLPDDLTDQADRDEALPIGHGSTCSQPSTVQVMLELLDPQPGDRVLDVGSGSGWTTAIIAELVGPQGWVRGTEVVPELVDRSRQQLLRAGYPHASVHVADPEVLGAPAHGPYDRILVSAQTEHVPQPLVDQLAEGGRLVLPLQGRLVALTKRGAELEEEQAAGYYRFVPLQGG